MNATMSRNLIRFVAAPVAAAGIMGGAALGFAALANASTPPACTYTGSATQCQTPGNVQINTSQVTRRCTPLSSSIHSSGMAMAVCCFITAAATADG